MQSFYKFQKILCVIVLLTTCGCLYPSASNSEPSGPTPSPDSKVLAIANSLLDAEREDCVKMYGVFTAFSRYVEDGHRGIDNTKQMLDLWKKTLDNLGWDKEKYPKFTDAVEAELKSRGFEDSKPMGEAKSTVIEAFKLIAAGCKHAANSSGE